MKNDYAELNIENIDMAAKLAEVDRLMVQCNKEDGDPFNFTAIVLVKKETTGINTLNVEREMLNGEVYNLAGQRVHNPRKGLYIVNGKKVMMK
jgi:hypothetical protein